MTRPAPLTCRELIGFIADYLDGEISSDERASFDEHLSRCPYCRDYLDSYRETVRLGRSALDPEGRIPESVPEELIQAVLASRRRGRRSSHE